MDHHAVIRTYGNPNLPESTPECPLVTFAVFAYNQEKYIREAVEGAFAQTYSPLEIILSDDCSSDRTFEIMEQMAREYRGPHRVMVRRNPFNFGTAAHVQSAFQCSKGQLFVVASGDDISKNNRVSAIVNAWLSAGRPEGVVHSGREVFRNGRVIRIEKANRYRYSDRVLVGYTHDYWLPAAAPTCAYTRGVFERFDPLIGGSIIEDAPLQLRAALLGTFIPCDEPLVRTRLHDANSGTGYSVSEPARWNRFMQSKLIAFRTMQRDLAGWRDLEDPSLRRKIEQRILRFLKSAPRLILPETRSLDLFEKAKLAVLILTAPAVARTFRMRAETMLSMFGFSFHDRLKSQLRSMIAQFLKN